MNARLILTTSCLLLLAHTEAAEWEKLPSLPEPNGGFVVGVDQGKVVIAGGTNWEGGQKNWLKKVRAFDPKSLKWEARADLDRATAYAVTGTRDEITKKSVMVFGGGANADGALPFVQFLGKDELDAKPASLPSNLVIAAGGVHVNSLVVCGGTPNAAEIEKASKATWSIDLDTLKVTPLAPFPGPPFVTAASTMDLFGRLFVFGGGTWDAKNQTVLNLDAAHAFDVKKNTWKKLRPLPYAVRGISAAMLYQDKPKGGSIVKSFVYLAGGYKNDTDGFTDEAFIYNTDTDEYRPAVPLPYKAMVSLVVCEGYLYCLGGEDKKQSRSDACYRIRLEDLLK
jgi:N-acetylneuraminic acid mutarotase